MLIEPGELLKKINSPDDLKILDQAQLVQLSQELRQFIIDHVSVYGGHFGASLGVVELTIALHHVFNTPHDLLVWDVAVKRIRYSCVYAFFLHILDAFLGKILEVNKRERLIVCSPNLFDNFPELDPI